MKAIIIAFISIFLAFPASAVWYASLEFGWVVEGSPFLHECPEDIKEEYIEGCPQTYSDMQIGYRLSYRWDAAIYVGIITYTTGWAPFRHPYRDNYYMGISANPNSLLEFNIYHECAHPVVFYTPIQIKENGVGHWTTMSVKIKFEGKLKNVAI